MSEPTADDRGTGLRKHIPPRALLAVKILLAAGIPLGGGYMFVTRALPWMLINLGMFATFTLIVGFLAGVGIIPLLGYGIPGILPPMAAEPLANTLWLIGGMAMGPTELYQHASGKYEIRRAEADRAPKSNWSTFMGTSFTLNYERVPETFGNFVEHVDTDVLVADGGDGERLPGTLVEYGPSMCGIGTVIDASEEGPFVRVYQILEKLQSACGVGEIDRAELDSLTEHTGEDSASMKWQTIGVIAMGLAGAVFGWLTLF